MELHVSKEEFIDMKKAIASNQKLRDLVITLKEFDLIDIDDERGIIAFHSATIPAVLDRSLT